MGFYSINPNYQDLDHLSNLHIGPDAAIHMSPKKKETKQTTINELNENAEKQNFHATVIDIPMVKTYPKCPMVGCRKSLYYNENTNTYSCDSCVKKYYVSAKGLTIKVTVEEDNASKDITFFNESAEKFLNATAEDILKDTEKIVEKVIGDRYSFVVKVGKLKNEYICVASNLITKKQDDSKFIEKSAEPLSSDVNNNDDLPPHWRNTPTEKKVKQQLQFDNVKDDQSCGYTQTKVLLLSGQLRQRIMEILHCLPPI